MYPALIIGSNWIDKIMPEEPSSTVRFSRVLIAMRHAKSDWSDGSLSDHDRPLNKRGCRDAPRLAHWLDELNLVPDLILSSTSERTRQTAALMRQEWKRDPVVSYTQSLYLAGPDAIKKTIGRDGCDVERLMVLAHNPGIAHFVSLLAGKQVDMPTAAIAVFRVTAVDWSKFNSDDVELVQYMRPKAL